MHSLAAVLVATYTLVGVGHAAALPSGKAPVISLKSRHVSHSRSSSRFAARFKDASVSNVPLSVQFNGTELQWFGPAQIGTPPQDFTFVYDTGSTDVLVPSTLCNDPGCTTHDRYNPSASSTFVNTSRPFNESFFTGGGVDPTQFFTTAGFVARDTVTVGGLAAKSQSINAVVHQSIQFAPNPYDGVFGLGLGDPNSANPTFFQSLINTRQVSQPVFGFYFSPVNVGNAEMTLGGFDSSRIAGPLQTIPVDVTLSRELGTVFANFTDVLVNGRATGNPGGAIMDTGTTNIIAPTNAVAQDVYAQISDKILLVNNLGIFAAPCDELNNTKSTVSFVFGGVPFLIPSRELNVGPLPDGEATISAYKGRTDLCQAFINGAGLGNEIGPAFDSAWIIGGSLLKYYYSVWNYQTAGLQLAKTVQSP